MSNTQELKLHDTKQKELRDIANALVAQGRGILVVDEEDDDISQMLTFFSMPNTKEMKRNYRILLFSSDPSMSKYISGVILEKETLYEKLDDGQPIIRLLQNRGIMPGIRVDRGFVKIISDSYEYVTEGLDGLIERCNAYKKDGCHFAKWRSMIRISDTTPSLQALTDITNAIVSFSAICQQAVMVPLIQIEVSSEGNFDLSKAKRITECVLSIVVRQLNERNIYLEGLLFSVSIVKAGDFASSKYSTEQISLATVQSLQRTIPPAVPGILFLNGGLTELEAISYLNSINQMPTKKPWKLSFAFDRVLQHSVLGVWLGKHANKNNAKGELLKLARASSEAVNGRFSGVLDTLYGRENTEGMQC